MSPLPELPITVSVDQRQVVGDQKNSPHGEKGVSETHRGHGGTPKGAVAIGALRYTEGSE